MEKTMLYDEQIVDQTFDQGGGLMSRLIASQKSVATFHFNPEAPIRSTLVKGCVVKLSKISTGLSLRFARNIMFKKCIIYGGVDCAVKIARSRDIVFESCKFISASSRTHVSVCAGSGNILFKNCIFDGNLKSGLFRYCATLGSWDNANIIDRPCVHGIGFKSCKILSKNARGLCWFLYSEAPQIKHTGGKVFGVPRWLVNLLWKINRKKLQNKKLNNSHKKIFEMEVPS